MGLHKTKTIAALTAADPQTIGTVYLGAKVARVVGFVARNWASAAKAAGGTDTTQRVKLTDAAGVVFFLDAADVDYKTALKHVAFAQDTTVTGLNVKAADATGAAITDPGQVIVGAVSPVTVVVTGGGTTTDYFEIFLITEVDGFVREGS